LREHKFTYLLTGGLVANVRDIYLGM